METIVRESPSHNNIPDCCPVVSPRPCPQSTSLEIIWKAVTSNREEENHEQNRQ